MVRLAPRTTRTAGRVLLAAAWQRSTCMAQGLRTNFCNCRLPPLDDLTDLIAGGGPCDLAVEQPFGQALGNDAVYLGPSASSGMPQPWFMNSGAGGDACDFGAQACQVDAPQRGSLLWYIPQQCRKLGVSGSLSLLV